jgi:NADH:ubiquinone oxidoreductase subunit K
LTYFLLLAAAIFCIGLYGALVRRNAVGILMALELMLNAVNINLVAFSRSITPTLLTGQIFAIFVITIAAAEAAVGLAIIIALYRTRKTINADEIALMRGYGLGEPRESVPARVSANAVACFALAYSHEVSP